MSLEFLSGEQVEAFGRFTGVPSRSELDRFCVLSDTDVQRARQRRRPQNRLGFAVQLVTVRVGPVREPSRDASPPESTGELTALYADPTVAGTGAGHAAHEAGLGHLASQGYTHVILWALRDNLPALRFHRTHGWSPDSVARDADIAGRAVPLVRWSRPCPERPTTLYPSQ